jgi:protein gp37
MVSFKIDQDLRDLISPISSVELESLEASLVEEGCRDALVVWKEKGLLLDGHNRYEICKRLKIEYRTVEISLPDRTAAEIWIINNQLSRRNLNDFSIGELKLKLKPRLAAQAKAKEEARKRGETTSRNSGKSFDTDADLSALPGPKADSLRAIERVIESGSADLIRAARSGEISSSAAAEIATLPKAAQKDVVSRGKNAVVAMAKSIKEVRKSVTQECRETKKSKPVFNPTTEKIDWARWSWNPVTGCELGCKYCYARDIANRFYPEKFKPTFHPERLGASDNTKVPSGIDKKDRAAFGRVFVCSMADLFGSWVPKEWIDAVIKEAVDHPEWEYLFLTKNPKRYLDFEFPENSWLGTTIDVQKRIEKAVEVFKELEKTTATTWISCEPLLSNLEFPPKTLRLFDFIVVGGGSASTETPATQPEWGWVQNLTLQADADGDRGRVYFKPNLQLMRRDLPLRIRK